MNKLFLLFTALLFTLSAKAEYKEVIYSLKVGETFKAGQTIEKKDTQGNVVVTVTYGEKGNAFSAAVSDSHIDNFPAYTPGNGANGNSSEGTFYTIVPKYNGLIRAAVVLNANKEFYITEDETALENYNGITKSEKTYDFFIFECEAGKSYKLYCPGSKLGFYGFYYSWDDNTSNDTDTNPTQVEDEKELGIGTGTIRYASPTGTSTSGLTPELPGSLTSMISKLSPGDVLYLLDGQYDLKSTVSINKSGTAEKYIMIAPYEGAKPILDFRNQANKQNGVKVGGSYLYIKGITIRFAGYKGIWLESCQHNILENLDVYGCCNAGIQLRSGGYNLVINCDSHDNFDYQDDGGNADGFADKQGDACPGNIYIGCRAWGNSDDGWDSFQRVTDGTPTVYVNCITYNNGPATFDLSKHPRATGVDKSLECFSGKSLANFVNGGNPNGFKVGGKGTLHNVELYRCLAVGHRSKGFDQNNNAGKMKLVNCSAYGNKYNYGFGNSYAYTLYLYNNISLAPTGGSSQSYHVSTSSAGTVYQGNNSWTSGFAVNNSYFESVDTKELLGEVDEFGNQLLKARNEDGSLPYTSFMRLSDEAVNAIDKGRNYTAFEGEKIAKYISYNGPAPDLGCYEYVYHVAMLEGDVNEDGLINITDVVAVINHIAGTQNWPLADVNEDKSVNITDVVKIINIIAGN